MWRRWMLTGVYLVRTADLGNGCRHCLPSAVGLLVPSVGPTVLPQLCIGKNAQSHCTGRFFWGSEWGNFPRPGGDHLVLSCRQWVGSALCRFLSFVLWGLAFYHVPILHTATSNVRRYWVLTAYVINGQANHPATEKLMQAGTPSVTAGVCAKGHHGVLCGTGCHISASRFQAHNDTSALREHSSRVCSVCTMHGVPAKLEDQVLSLQSCWLISPWALFLWVRGS